MKIIEALKQIKMLEKRVLDLNEKIRQQCADTELETPTYPDQRGKVAEWLQSNHDTIKEIERLRLCINRTNVLTPVTITLGNSDITKPIASWIHRRKTLATLERASWEALTDKGLRDQSLRQTINGEVKNFKVRLYFDPQERDNKVLALKSELYLIDAKLEIVNATVDLLEN